MMLYFEMVNAINGMMKELNYSKAKLARTIGVTRNTINNWLHSYNPMPADYMLTIIHELGLDVQLIIKEEEK